MNLLSRFGLLAALLLAVMASYGCGDSPETKLATAILALQTGTPAQALELADEVIDSQPENMEARRIRAEAQIRLNRLEDAKATIDDILQREPEKIENHKLMNTWAIRRMEDLRRKSNFSTSNQLQQQYADTRSIGQREAQWLGGQEGQKAEAFYRRARIAQQECSRVEDELRELRSNVASELPDDPRSVDIKQKIQTLERQYEDLLGENEELLAQAIKEKPDYHLAQENLVEHLMELATRGKGRTEDEEQRLERERTRAWNALWPLAQTLSKQPKLPPSLVGKLMLAVVHMPDSLQAKADRMETARALQQAAADSESNNRDYLVAIAKLHLSNEEYEKAKPYLEKVKSGDREGQYLLAYTYYRLEEYEKANNILKSLTTDSVLSQSSDVWVLYGQTRLALDDRIGAEQAVGQARKLNPNDPNAMKLWVQLKGENLPELGDQVKSFYEANPQDPVAIRQMILYLQATGDIDGSQRLLAENVSTIDPLTDDLLNVLVDGYFIVQDYPQAEKYARQLAERQPNELDAQLRLTQAMLMQGKTEEVRAMITQLRDRFPKATNVDQMLAGLYLERGQLDRALELLTPIVEADPSNHEARLLLARALIGQALLEDALTHVQAVLEDRPEDVLANTLAARIYEIKGQTDEADKYINRISPDEMDEARYPIPAARLAARKGDLDKAAEILNNALARGYTDPTAHAFLAAIYEEQNKKSQAEFQLLALARRSPDSMAAYRFLAQHYVKNQDLNRGLDQLRNLATQGGNEGWARLAQSYLYLAMSPPRVEDAINAISDHYTMLVLKKDRQALALAAPLASLYMARGEPDRAMAVYDAMIQDGFMVAQARLRQVELLRAAQKNDEAVNLLEQVADTVGDSEPVLRYQVMRQFSQLGKLDRAMQLLDRWIAAEPEQATLYRWKGEELMRAGRADAAAEAYQKAVSLSPQNAHLRQLLANSYAAQFKYPEVEATLNEMETLDRGAQIAALAAKGHMFLRLGLTEQADHAFSELEKLDRPKDPRVVLAVAQSLADMRKDDQAKYRLEQIPRYAQQYPAAQILWARIEQRAGETEKARQRLVALASQPAWMAPAVTEIMRLNLSSASETNLLEWIDEALTVEKLPVEQRRGWLHTRLRLQSAKGDWNEALTSVEQLVDLEPNAIQPQVARILLLMTLDRLEKARQVFRSNEALAQSAYGPSLVLLIGEPYAPDQDRQGLFAWIEAMAVGDLDRAKALVETLPPMPTLFRSDLNAMLNRSDANSGEIKTAARFMLGAALALNVGLPHLADGLLTNGLEKVPNAVPLYSLRMLALTELRRPVDANMDKVKAAGPSAFRLLLDADAAQKSGDHARAAQIATQLLVQEPENDHVRYYLAQQLQFARQFDQAIETLRPLVNKEGPHHNAAANDLAYLIAEHQPDKIDEAYQIAKTAFEENPHNAALRDTMGWLEYAKGNYPAAREHLARAVSQLAAIPDVHLHMALTYKALGNPAWTTYHLQAAARGPEDNPTAVQARDLLRKM